MWRRLKKIDKLIVNSFWMPYVVSFFVAEFVLVMQFMWKYIDEILGKGFPILTLFELIFYYAVQLIPQAIPLTILISSIMVFGNLSERYELTCMKSAGISLFRIMRAAIVIAFLTAGFSFISSNNLKPKANYQFYKRFRSITDQKPSLSLEEGIFNNDFKDYIIRIGEKEKDDITIHDILIYDHTDIDRRKVNVIRAKDGKMYNKGNSFIMDLYDGYQYKEAKSGFGKNARDNYPLTRTEFKRFTKVFDMSQFDLNIDNINTSRRKHDMMNHSQLSASVDSFYKKRLEKIEDLKYEYSDMIDIYESDTLQNANEEKPDLEGIPEEVVESEIDARKNVISKGKVLLENKPTVQKPIPSKKRLDYGLMVNEDMPVDSMSTFYDYVHKDRKTDVLDVAVKDATGFRQTFTEARNTLIGLDKQIELYKLRIHQQFSFAIICIVFLFIGAPLGSIIRKGGYGYPLLIAIIFYVTFIITTISGDKLVRRSSVPAEIGAWLPVIIMLPISILVTYLAIKDKKMNLTINIPFLNKKAEEPKSI